MKSLNKYLITVVAILLMWSMAAGAQESFSWENHKHSLEIYTGYPYIFSMLYPKSSPDNTASMDGWFTGDSYKYLCPASLTLMYSYRLDQKWEISFLLNGHGYFYKHAKYPVADNRPVWEADPEYAKTEFDTRGIVIGLITRRYWLDRDFWKLYSALGFGAFLVGEGLRLPVAPEIIPIGTRFGRRHIYGMAELSFGPTGTGPRLGLGYRF